MSEYDPIAELGLTHDKQLVCSLRGFLQLNNSTRDLCQRFIGKGDRFYDMISRYDDIIAHVLNRTEGRSGNTTKFVVPFLKAFGITDYAAVELCEQKLKLMPEARRAIGHLMETLPTFFTTSSYEHDILNVCERLNIPRGIIDCSEIDFDYCDMGRYEARALREMVRGITNLKMPRYESELNLTGLQRSEVHLVRALDEMLSSNINDQCIPDIMRQIKSVGANEKAYFLMDLKRRTQIEFDGTAFIGGDITDAYALDAVNEKDGLAMAFNGCDFAVRKSNIAVISRDCTVAAVLIQEFYNEGIEAVFDLVENWNRETLEKKDFPDPYLMSAMLASNSKKLPEVHIVTKDNADDIAKKSDAYRKKLFR